MQENKSTSCVLGYPKSTGNLQKSVAARENTCPKIWTWLVEYPWLGGFQQQLYYV